jgi:predicted dehydrogenase
VTTLPDDLPTLDVAPGPVRGEPLPADRPVRWGVLATGKIAGAVVPDLVGLDDCEVVAVAARRQESADAFAARHGIPTAYGDYRSLVEDPDVDVVYVATPHALHREHVELAFEAGKPVLCEKPLGATLDEARALRDAAEEAGVANAVGFNYRYVPAVALARETVDAGRLGELRHYRALYLQDYQVAGGQARSSGGAGAVLDYVHLVDLLRFLVGEPQAVTARTASFVSDVDDAYAAILELGDGAIATLEASRVASGWKGRHRIELNGSDGSIWWDMEDPNRLHVFLFADERERLGGFRDIVVTQPDHPFLAQWWPPGHVLGWEHSFVHQWRDFLSAVVEDRAVPERQASFEDGYRAAILCEAIHRSGREGRRVSIAETAAAI